jgi:predicted ATPase/DNA-binding CsgD family transcriptional regulator
MDDVTELLAGCRLVTVTGAGGAGKTRLAAEVARRVAGRFADGVWLVELGTVTDPEVVPTAVAATLGLPQPRDKAALADVLAARQLMVVLDNCEHLLAAAAGLCRVLLPAADDVRVLATSREPLGVAGEARYRLGPLGLPQPGDLAGASRSEAVTLFADRASRVDPNFTLDRQAGSTVASLVQHLDGIPLAIELAAARVESLGLAGLMDRLPDRLRLLAGPDRGATARHRSLAAAVDWSYQLLGEDEQQVFRKLAVFAGPFTLAAAETVAGAQAALAVLHLVDCSLLSPPRPALDGRARYVMLETLRAYGSERLAEHGEQPQAAAALTVYALHVAEQAGAALQTNSGELAAIRWLDAEDAVMRQALAWAREHDPDAALRLAACLAPWWLVRGRAVDGYALLHQLAERGDASDDQWATVQLLLGRCASSTGDFTRALGHFTSACDSLGDLTPSPLLADGLGNRAASLLNLGRLSEGADQARLALAAAREIGYPAGELRALMDLATAASYSGDSQEALARARQAQRIDPAGVPGRLARQSRTQVAIILKEAGELAAARDSCADGLASAREAGDLLDQGFWLELMADLAQQAGRIPESGAHLREAFEISTRIVDRLRLIDCLECAGQLCAATRRWAEALTLWAAHDVALQDNGIVVLPADAARREEPARQARHALGPDRARSAEERGKAMRLATAAEYAVMLTTDDQQPPQTPPGAGRLSVRERELVTLVAQGRTDAQIAAQLFISVRTVGSHLDRIRDKTGCRRRADLTRLALDEGLV